MNQRSPVLVNILIVVGILFIVYYMFIQSMQFLSSSYFWGTVVVSVILVLIHDALGDLIENERFKRLTDEEKRLYLEGKRVPFLQRLWRDAVRKQSAQEEEVLIIDHGFDGIKELNNQLPKWWLGLFYFGCAYCVVYLLSYFSTDFAHPVSEYELEHKTQLASIEAFEKTAPRVTLETARYSPDNIEEGEQLFKINCVSCHGEGGKGGIGPNLTDDYWINVMQDDVFHNVFWIDENGSPNNPAMRGFVKDGELTGRDVEKIAAYVYHINQELPPIGVSQGGAPPQGSLAPWVTGTPRE